MFKVVYGGFSYPYLKAGEEIVVGQPVMVDSDGNIVVSDGSKVLGIAAESAVDVTSGDYRPIIGRVVGVGEPIGVWVDGGIYESDNIKTGAGITYAPNADLYVTSKGYLVPALASDETVGETAGVVKVGRILEVFGGTTPTAVRFQLML